MADDFFTGSGGGGGVGDTGFDTGAPPSSGGYMPEQQAYGGDAQYSNMADGGDDQYSGLMPPAPYGGAHAQVKRRLVMIDCPKSQPKRDRVCLRLFGSVG